MKIPFYSTNKVSPEVSIKEAILVGQAPDKGLYMPKFIPKLTEEEISSFRKMEYPEIAYLITSKFLDEFVPEDKLREICADAYNFEIPIELVKDKQYIMRLDRGPTASFKDFAARMMARVMNYFLEEEDKKLLILTATSGDTGGAVADAFYGQNNVKVVVLYPQNEVSGRQRKQMTTLGKNISAIGVDGKFDDCQRMVKEAFADPNLKIEGFNLSSANSINFARLLPQSVYYFYAYSRITKDNNQKVIFSVPSGNFGDLMGGLLASKMGLPVIKFISAVNENDEFPKFLESGVYNKIEPSKNCLSSAMNVGHPSNLARLIDLFEGQLDEKGTMHKKPNMEELKKIVTSVSISDALTKDTIVKVYKEYKKIIEPHGSVGWAGLQWYLNKQFDSDFKNKYFNKQSIGKDSLNKEDISFLSLETADPSKFPEVITEFLDISPKMPKHLEEAQLKKEKIQNLSNDYQVFKDFLQDSI